MLAKILMLDLLLILILLRPFDTTVSNFMRVLTKYDLSTAQQTELPDLIHFVVLEYLHSCTPYVMYDDFFFETVVYRDALLQTLEKLRSTATIQGSIHGLSMEHLYAGDGRQSCFSFVVFANDVEMIMTKLDFQLRNRVILIPTMSKWQVKEFVESPIVRNIQNLLILCDPVLQQESYLGKTIRKDINMYTHRLHVDGIGSTGLMLLTAWRNHKLTRPQTNLFPPKLDSGLNGHRLVVSAFEQPPFVLRKSRNLIQSDNIDAWDGLEVRLLKMVAESLNISLSIQDTVADNETSATDEVINTIVKGKADVGISGIYVSRRYYHKVYFSLSHSQDCATCITLSSTAIPKYRAILGPFQWGVWLCVIFLYMLSIIPITFSLKYEWSMFENCGEVGTVLWMVFGTFTNLFTYRGESSWNSVKKSSTRTVVGTYWIFTIIITAAYSSSIISFIMLANYYDPVDSLSDLEDEGYRIGVVDARDWSTTFNDTTDSKTNKIMKRVELLNSSVIGLENVRTRKMYAFLNSRAFLEHAVRSNSSYSSLESKKATFHILSQCVAPFMVSFVMKPKTDFLAKFDDQIQRLQENGIIKKMMSDIYWDISRSGKGRLFAISSSGSLKNAAPEDRQLTTDDTQGMFLLLGIGLVMAGVSLLHEFYRGFQCYDETGSLAPSRRPSVPSIILTTCENKEENLSAKKKVTSPTSMILLKPKLIRRQKANQICKLCAMNYNNNVHNLLKMRTQNIVRKKVSEKSDRHPKRRMISI